MLLIMACAAPKLEGAQLAGYKYTTRQHRALVEEFFGEGDGYLAGNEAVILSAKFGVVPCTSTVEDYDQCLDKARAQALCNDATQVARMARAVSEQRTVYIYGGTLYRHVARTLLAQAGYTGDIIELIGLNRGCGDHFSALCDLLTDLSVEA
jgi:hypothetical protein